MNKNKKVIYLSLNDLKELGIIKKRSKRRRRHGRAYLNYPNTRSASDHMVGHSTTRTVPTQFMNTSNLQSDNLRLNNLLLENKLKEDPQIKNVDNSQIDTLQKAVDKQQNNYYYITGLMEQNRFNQPTHTSPFNSAYVNTVEKVEDTPATFGSDYFKSQQSDNNSTQGNDEFYYDNIFKPTSDIVETNVNNDSQFVEEPVIEELFHEIAPISVETIEVTTVEKILTVS